MTILAFYYSWARVRYFICNTIYGAISNTKKIAGYGYFLTCAQLPHIIIIRNDNPICIKTRIIFIAFHIISPSYMKKIFPVKKIIDFHI